MLKVGIIGCGLIGKKRAKSLLQMGSRVTLCYDTDLKHSEQLVNEFGGRIAPDWQAVVASAKVDAVVVATPNHLHLEIALQSFEHRKHVLCEKPLATTAHDANIMVKAAKKNHCYLKTGFNHRHHPGIRKAKQLIDSGVLGELYYMRGCYGHGGRSGYDLEWRGNASLSGGGELLDQGVHLLDLSRWFFGEFKEVFCQLGHYHWKNTPLEDNAFCLLRTEKKQTVTFHTSWTQWKNQFLLEIYGHDGYLKIEGLTGYYGAQRLCVGKKTPASPIPQETWEEFSNTDVSWDEEWSEFETAVREKREPMGNGMDGWASIRLVEGLYRSSKEGRQIQIF